MCQSSLGKKAHSLSEQTLNPAAGMLTRSEIATRCAAPWVEALPSLRAPCSNPPHPSPLPQPRVAMKTAERSHDKGVSTVGPWVPCALPHRLSKQDGDPSPQVALCRGSSPLTLEAGSAFFPRGCCHIAEPAAARHCDWSPPPNT